MARAKIKASKKVRRPVPPPAATFEPTTERMRQAGNDNSELVPAAIHRAADRQARCRRFRDDPVSRMFKQGHLTFAQWFAADWYRTKFEMTGLPARVVSNYGASSGGGECNYGMPTSERQAKARQAWRAARALIPGNIAVLVDALVLHDHLPSFANGQQRARFGARIARALQPMAEWINAPQNT